MTAKSSDIQAENHPGPAAPKPEVAIPAVPPVSAVPPVAGPPPPKPQSPGTTPESVSERESAEVTTLQRRADEIASEGQHHDFDAIAIAATAAASLVHAATSLAADHDRGRSVTLGSVDAPERNVLASAGDAARSAAMDVSPDGVDALATDEFAAASDDVEIAGPGDLSPSSDPADGSPALSDDPASNDLSIDSVDPVALGAGEDGPDFEHLAASSGRGEDLSGADVPGHTGATDAPRGGGPAEVGTKHPDAAPWNGQTSIGTISYVDGDRAEQYAGRGQWTSFSIKDQLNGVAPQVGETLQINSDGTFHATPEQQLAAQPLQMDRGRALT